MVCSSCGHSNPEGSNFCEECGAALAPSPAVSAGPPNASPRVSPEPAPREQAALDPAQAATLALDAGSMAATGWTCACGASNPADEEFCGQCGEQRSRRAPLQTGEQFAGFEVVSQRGDGSYAVGGDLTSGREATLLFAAAAEVEELLATVSLLGAGGENAVAAVPAILARGEDERGSWTVVQLPEGDWEPLLPGTLTSQEDAGGVLNALLGSAERAASARRLLLVSPMAVLRDGGRALLPRPSAPATPVRGALLADPAWLAPELRAAQADAAPWPAAAYSVASVVRAAAGAGLRFRAEWHSTLAALLSDDPARRPQRASEAAALLVNAADSSQCVATHTTAVLTDIGKHHPVNQDAGGAWSWHQADGTPVTLAVVADGVSAGLHSEEASAIAVEVVRTAIEPLAPAAGFGLDAAEAALRQAAIEAQARVAALPSEDPETASATTLVAVCAIGSRAVGVWCGDSRAYGVTPDGCHALTRDHSWVNLVVERGLLTEEEARRDPRAHVITRWLGPSDPPREDPGLESFRLSFVPGERLLVCSDGLYMYFQPPDGDERELAVLAYPEDGDLAGAAQHMVETALARGGYDNITVVLVAFA